MQAWFFSFQIFFTLSDFADHKLGIVTRDGIQKKWEKEPKQWCCTTKERFIYSNPGNMRRSPGAGSWSLRWQAASSPLKKMGQNIQPNRVKNKISTLQVKIRFNLLLRLACLSTKWREETLSMELRCLSWQAEWFWRAHILIVIIDFGSVFFSCKVIVVVEGEVWQFITQHSRILSLSSYVGKKKEAEKNSSQWLSKASLTKC